MAFTAGEGSYVYDDNAVREDLLDLLTIITPKETHLVTSLPVGSASNTLHQWLEEELGAVKTNAYAEGVDASYGTLTNPAKLTNWTQIFREGYQVSDSEEVVNTAAYNSRVKHEAMKALLELRNDMEYAVLRGSMACGDGSASAARQLQGIKNWLSIVTSQSGVSLTETILGDYLETAWDQGVNVTKILAPMYHKRKITGFSTSTGRYTTIEDKTLPNTIGIYESDASEQPIKLVSHKYVRVSGDTHYDIVGIQEGLWKLAYLRKPKPRTLAKTGDSEKAELVTELTLECHNGFGGFLGQQHT